MDPLSIFSTAQLQHVHNATAPAPGMAVRDAAPLFTAVELAESLQSIRNWPGYCPTPLVTLPGLAKALNVAEVLYKDEGERFGLGSFKALGGAYAVSRIATANSTSGETLTVATATDGNHGLSVAWGAKIHGYRAVIYVHAEVSERRENALKSLGAKVVRVAGNYDASVRMCYQHAAEYGWTVVSDTTSNGAGAEIARTVMAGYSVMAAEVVEQFSGSVPTHVFVQAGVGGLAATVCAFFRMTYQEHAPRFIVVEPELAACLYASASEGNPTAINICEETVMAGLSCGEASAVAWPTLSQFTDDFVTIPDSLVAPTMKLLIESPFGDTPIVAGESAVAGLAGLIAVQANKTLRQALEITEHSRVLVFGTEGATDPVVYEQMTGHSAGVPTHDLSS